MELPQGSDAPADDLKTETNQSRVFDVGTFVCLVGLERRSFNYHIGRVVTAPIGDGRVGVALHGVLKALDRFRATRRRATDPGVRFDHCPVREGSSGHEHRRGSVGVSPSVAGEDEKDEKDDEDEYPPISLKQENLRQISWPEVVQAKAGAKAQLPSMVRRPICTSVVGTEEDTGDVLTMVGCINHAAIVALFGDRGWGLPANAADSVAEHLRVRRVRSSEVRVTGCSSTRGDYPLDVVLNNRLNEWWISGAGTMSNGIGEEYLEFAFLGIRRISVFGLRIPPLPHGPLSVRDFHLMVPSSFSHPKKLGASGEDTPQESWRHVTPQGRFAPSMYTLDRGDLQEFLLVPPVDASSVRLVCTRNAAARSHAFAECVGLFQVRFA